jgi:23S rRNA (adenine1618-N6)-methyltransferase
MFEIMNQSTDDISDKIDKELSSLRIHWTWRKNLATGVGFAMENVWSRQARRKLQNSAGAADMMEIDESVAALGFKVQLKQDRLDEKCVRVVVRWLKGLDSVLFESFCGMLKRKVEGR